jgi:hypothetical protein
MDFFSNGVIEDLVWTDFDDIVYLNIIVVG